MSRSEFLNFCLTNAVILLVLYTIFIIFFVSYIVKKVTQLKRLFDSYLISTQNSYQDFLKESSTIDKQSWQIKKNQEKAIIDINYVISLLERYKGKQFNTEINHQVSNEILSKINENLKHDIPICDTSSIVDNNLINIYDSIKENTLSIEEEKDTSLNDKIIINNSSFSQIASRTIDIGQSLGYNFSKIFNTKNNKFHKYDENNYMKEL